MRPRTTFHRPHRAPATVSLRSLPTVFGLFALLVTGGRTAESSPTFEVDEAMEPQLNRSAARCTNVRGTLVGNVFGESAVKGDLEGTTVAYKEPVVEQRGQAIHLQTFHLIRLKDGEIYTEDEGVQAPIDPPVYRLNNRYTIVRGTGAYANASGTIQLHATLVMDFTGQHPDNGSIDGTYHGRICR